MTLNKIILIDDDETTNLLNRRMVKKMEITNEVVLFSDGKLAMDYLTSLENKFDDLPELIFLDVRMPVMGGFDFLNAYVELKQSKAQKTKIIMLSTSLRDEDMNKAKSFGVADYVAKPLNKTLVSSLIEKHFTNIVDG